MSTQVGALQPNKRFSRLRRLASNRSLRLWLGVVLAVILMAAVLRGVNLSELRHSLINGRIGFLAAALAVVLISPFLRAWRWRALFAENRPDMTSLVGAVTAGQTLNLLMPFRSGDAARLFMVENKKWSTAGTIAVEKAVDSAFFAAICLWLPLVWIVPDSLEGPRMTAIAAAGAFAVAGFFVLPRLPRMEIRLDARTAVVLLASSILIWIGSVLNNYFVLRFLRLDDLPWTAPVALLVILQVGAAVPSTPGRVGVFQALAVLGLSLFGVAETPALGFGLVLHALVLLPVAVMALAIWFFKTKR